VDEEDTFLHNLAVDLALEAVEVCRGESFVLSDGIVDHLSEAFHQALIHIRDARKESH